MGKKIEVECECEGMFADGPEYLEVSGMLSGDGIR